MYCSTGSSSSSTFQCLLPRSQSGFRGHNSARTPFCLCFIYLTIDRQLTLLALVLSPRPLTGLIIPSSSSKIVLWSAWTPHIWFESYLADCSHTFMLRDSVTTWSAVKFGVPQVSFLGPMLYILRTVDILSLLLNTWQVVIPTMMQRSLVRQIASLSSDLTS